MNALPIEFQTLWRASLDKAAPHSEGTYDLIDVRKTKPKTGQELKVIVLVVDENSMPIHNVPVAFAYTTAEPFIVTPDFTWSVPTPRRADIFPTDGSGQIEHVQGSVVKPGEPGGITVFVFDPKFGSDIVIGAGALADHSGMFLTYQLRRNGVKPLTERLDDIEARLDALEAKAT